MTNNSPPGVVRHRGSTFLELSVVVTILLILISIVFIGASAWKRGSDRSSCVLTLRSVQVATRSYQNMYGYDTGLSPNSENGTQDIAAHLFSKGYIETNLYQQTRSAIPCPAGGSYHCPAPDVFPQPGQLYMECSLSGSAEHVPTSHADW